MNISNKSTYDKIAVRWTNERKTAFVSNLIIDFANKIKVGGKILDIGCGGGVPNASYLCNKAFELTGIDGSENMIDIAIENIPNSVFEVCDVIEYKPATSFDGILAWDSLFHLPYANQHDIYSKIYGWLNNGGWFLFSHTAVDGEIIDEMFDEKLYYSGLSTDVVRQLLIDAGFKITMMTEDYKERDMDKALVVQCQKIEK